MSDLAAGYWPRELPPECLAWADAYIEASAQACDAILPGFSLGDVLRTVWADVKPRPSCDCELNPHHRWNCALTPIWAQTIRDLDVNPWTVVRDAQVRAWNEYLDVMVEWWHDLAPDELDELHTFLGMAWDEYGTWTSRPLEIPARWLTATQPATREDRP